MKTHRLWMIALTAAVAMTAGEALGQAYGSFATFSQGQPVIQQASHTSCGACNGTGCTICGGSSTSFHALPGATDCGCGSGDCGAGGCGGGSCSGPACGNLASHGMAMQHLHAMHGGAGCGYVQENGPLGCGGCCAPIWYDVHVEWMNLFREDAGRRINLTSRNAGGPIVLSTDDLDLDDANGFRFTYSMLIGPSTNVEASYFGTHNWTSNATVEGAGDLWSVFSDFGTIFFGPVQGFPGTVDAANVHSISYSSELHNVEVNCRRRWVTENCLVHGSWLGGLRYVSLDEQFNHSTLAASGGSLNYDVDTANHAWGAQIGADMYLCVSPRFKIGVEVEGGLYANDTQANTYVTGVDGLAPINPVVESESETDLAVISEAGVIGLFRLTPRWTIRGGYQVMHMDGMALATENFNTAAPLLPRTSFIDNSGEVVLHGATFGMTLTW